MSLLTVLAIIGLVMCCGALSRRIGTSVARRLDPGDVTDRARDAEEQLTYLSEAHARLEAEMQARVSELEERLDLAERMLARRNAYGDVERRA